MGVSFDDMVSFAWARYAQRNPRNADIASSFISNLNIEKWVYDNKDADARADWLVNFATFVEDFDPSMGVLSDLTYVRNWGIVRENGKEKCAIIDDGLDEAIIKELYLGD